MKKSYTIELGGQLFIFSQEAEYRLDIYLQQLKENYAQEDDSSEIMNDIEMRIAELLMERLREFKRQVVEYDDIVYVIKIIGTPEEINVEYDESTVSPPEIKADKRTKRLYRDLENGKVGGVAAGIAAYFKIDVVFVRVIFILITFFYGCGIPAYLIGWLVIPVPANRKERLEMKGKPFTLDNLNNMVKENITTEENKGKVLSISKKVELFIRKCGRGLYNAVHMVISFIGTLGVKIIAFIKHVGQVVKKVLAIGLIVFAILLIITVVPILLFPGVTPIADYVHSVKLALGQPQALFVSISLLMATIALIGLTAYAGYLILSNRTYNKIAGMALVVMFVVGSAYAAITATGYVLSRSYYYTFKEKVELLHITDTIHLSSPLNMYNMHGLEMLSPMVQELSYNNQNVLGSTATINLRKSNDDKFRMEIHRSINAQNHQEAYDNARNLAYYYKVQTDTLLLPRFASQINPHRWCNEQVRVYIYVPMNKVICVDERNVNTIYSYSNHRGKLSQGIYRTVEEGVTKLD
ncbi:MAG: PspC domain-containing protein [Marinifilaceae bacterium]